MRTKVENSNHFCMTAGAGSLGFGSVSSNSWTASATEFDAPFSLPRIAQTTMPPKQANKQIYGSPIIGERGVQTPVEL